MGPLGGSHVGGPLADVLGQAPPCAGPGERRTQVSRSRLGQQPLLCHTLPSMSCSRSWSRGTSPLKPMTQTRLHGLWAPGPGGRTSEAPPPRLPFCKAEPQEAHGPRASSSRPCSLHEAPDRGPCLPFPATFPETGACLSRLTVPCTQASQMPGHGRRESVSIPLGTC